MKNNVPIISLIFVIGLAFGYASTYPLNVLDKPMVKTETHKYKEKDYVDMYCKGIREYRLPDKTRVDCLTDEYAIEFDYAKKWAEAIGQSLYYAKMTNKKPAIALILKSENDKRFLKRIQAVDLGIKVFEINAY